MNTAHNVRSITPKDLAMLGVQDMAYVRTLTVDGTKGYGIFAADGTPLAFTESLALAVAAVRQYDLQPVSVH
jgi:hypothetical protein